MPELEESQLILLARVAVAQHWQLGRLPPPHGSFILIGWKPGGEDGGSPHHAVKTMARALSSFGQVVIPSSSVSGDESFDWRRDGVDQVACLRVSGRPGRSLLTLRCTEGEHSIRSMFEDPVYPWWYQGQFALLCRRGTPPPDLEILSGFVGILLSDNWTSALAQLQVSGVLAVLRPGVDGDVAGLHCASDEVREELERCIEQAARACGVACQILSEADFMERLTTG